MQKETKEGQVRWFDEKKGYGFIVSCGLDYFVHYKQIMGTGFKNLTEGQKVSFTPSNGLKGEIAENVTIMI